MDIQARPSVYDESSRKFKLAPASSLVKFRNHCIEAALGTKTMYEMTKPVFDKSGTPLAGQFERTKSVYDGTRRVTRVQSIEDEDRVSISSKARIEKEKILSPFTVFDDYIGFLEDVRESVEAGDSTVEERAEGDRVRIVFVTKLMREEWTIDRSKGNAIVSIRRDGLDKPWVYLVETRELVAYGEGLWLPHVVSMRSFWEDGSPGESVLYKVVEAQMGPESIDPGLFELDVAAATSVRLLDTGITLKPKGSYNDLETMEEDLLADLEGQKEKRIAALAGYAVPASVTESSSASKTVSRSAATAPSELAPEQDGPPRFTGRMKALGGIGIALLMGGSVLFWGTAREHQKKSLRKENER